MVLEMLVVEEGHCYCHVRQMVSYLLPTKSLNGRIFAQ